MRIRRLSPASQSEAKREREPYSGSIWRALRALPESWTLELLQLPASPALDPPWLPVWDQRRFILAALHTAGGRPMPLVAKAVLAALPNDEQVAAEIAEDAASLSVEDGIRYFRDRLTHGVEGALESLARLGDEDTIRNYAREAARKAVSTSEIPKPLIAAIKATTVASDRRILLELLLNTWPGSLAALLPLSTEDRIDHPKLRVEAETVLSRSRSAPILAKAVGYLGAVDSAGLWRVVAGPAVHASLGAFLTDAEPSDWLMVAQSFPFDDRHDSVPIGAMSLAETRRIAVILKWGDVSEEAAEAGVLLLPEDKIVVNYLIAIATRQGEAARALTSISTLMQSNGSVVLLPSLADGSTVFQSYLNWLAATPLGVSQAECIGQNIFTADRLIDANPVVVRAAAAIALAVPVAAAKGVCASSLS
jgi:hypothetical protein